MPSPNDFQDILDKNNREWRRYLIERFDRLEDGTSKKISVVEKAQKKTDEKVNHLNGKIAIITTTVAAAFTFIVDALKRF